MGSHIVFTPIKGDNLNRICAKLGIYKTRTTPYRPQSDGMVERFNHTLQQMLLLFVNKHRNDWDDHSPYVIMAYRAAVHDSTKCSPNLLVLGKYIHVYFPIDIIAQNPPNSNEETC
jgi:transposase InsO family protein